MRRNDVRRFMSCLAGAAAAALAGPARADCPTYEFVVIADDTEELSLTDPDYLPDNVIPSLGPGGRVAFTSWLDAGGKAILVGDELSLVERVRDRDADPDSDWTFLGRSLLAGDIAFFTGELEVEQPQVTQSFPALGAVNNGKVIDEIAVATPGADFGAVGSLDVTSDGRVAFQSSTEEDGQVIAVAGFGQPARVIESGREGGYSDVSVGRVDEVSYLGYAQSGPFLVSASGAVVAETDPATGLGPEGPISMGPGTGIAYVFAYADPDRPGYAAEQIRRWNPFTQTSSTLADSASGDFSRHADGVTVSLLDQSELSGDGSQGWGGCVVFLGGADDGRDAIYIADDDGIDIVVQEQDEIDGDLVGPISMGPLAVNGSGQIAFWADLGARTAVIRADPVAGSGGGGGDDDGADGDDGDGDGGDDDDDGDGSDDGGADGGEGGCMSVARRGSASWLALVLAALALSARSRRRGAAPGASRSAARARRAGQSRPRA
ncbi:MAG TPA: hypothetical protein VNO33_24770 [Kofleriaceae bacterium]|nr:hypothetical protein [Kofleriaceae bacterium]